ncbi:8638_t:CDS:2 [Paraglomus occultum]|uniref:8638_t:CDS:1 n=1 Tax=Paraglomus occultum TaxID=144539 RepID=A0A9N9A255_9GLOM|nr:8638_t:CDS:2 [Paraglomus occultum]
MGPSTYPKNMQYSGLNVLNFPKNEGETIQLNDGRVIGYKEYHFYHQFTKNPQRQLRPVFLIPGLPGTRFFCHPNVIDNLVRDEDDYSNASEPASSSYTRRITLIVVERPGIGLSTFAKRTMLDFAEDVRELCIKKGITEFDLIGYSAGGPFGLAVGKVLGKKDGNVRLRNLAVISSVAPYHAPGCTSRMPLKFKIAWFVISFSLFRYGPVIVFRLLVIETNKFTFVVIFNALQIWAIAFIPYKHGFEARSSLRDPASSFRESLMDGPSSDIDICVAMPGIESMFVESALEMYTRGQSNTECYELSLWGKSWGFELNELKGDNVVRTEHDDGGMEAKKGASDNKTLRIKVWQGELDPGTTVDMASYIAQETGAELRVVEGKGHMIYFEVWDDVFEWFVTSE